MRAQGKGSWLPTRIRGIAIVVFSGALALAPGWLWLVAGEGGGAPGQGRG
jgi:hypothetical protein